MIKVLKYHLVAFLCLQLCLCFLYGYQKVYNKRPFSIHQWRQSDCASFTKNYYEEGMHFFQPRIHWQGAIEGKAISEFPLINYTVACLWKLFGEHESLYRLTVLATYLIALLCLFVMLYAISGSLFYSYFGATLISTSPVLAYYSFSFLADVPALSFSIMALSAFVLFLHKRRPLLFVGAVVLATLAVLLKASSMTVLLVMGAATLMHLLRFPAGWLQGERLFRSWWLPVLSFTGAVILIGAWYRYALIYNQGNSNGVFLMETLPVWNMQDRVIETARALYNIQFGMYFNKGVLLAFAGLAVWLLLNLKALPGYLKIAFLISLVSFAAFILLFFQVFDVHDYYLITTMIFPVILLACLGAYLKGKSFVFGRKLKFMLVLVFAANAIHCATIVRLRNVPGDRLTKYNPFISSEEKNFSDWFHANYENTLKPLESIRPYLRSLGIRRTDLVISAPDPSFNITLYLMDQKGFTATQASLQADSSKAGEYIGLGAKYLVLSDTSLLRTTALHCYVGPAIGRYQQVAIYKLRSPEGNKP